VQSELKSRKFISKPSAKIVSLEPKAALFFLTPFPFQQRSYPISDIRIFHPTRNVAY
jgi:hypothetical protein